MKFGKRITELRKKENITQEQLARDLGVTRQTISNWESNITSPDVNQTLELSKIFKVNINDLLDEQLEIQCKNTNSILKPLVGKECFIDLDDDMDDHRINMFTKCKIINIDENYIKFEFSHGKSTITKLIDITLVHSFKLVDKKGTKE